MAVARNGGVELYHESFGSPDHPTLLLVSGLGSQCVNFEVEWCEMFAARGFHVVRFDNRDVGLSTKLVDAPTGDHGEAYTLWDMAADAVAVLDANGVDQAHVLGVSMGGMIVQTMAVANPERLRSLTSVMSSTGEPAFGQPTAEALAHLTRPPAADEREYVEGVVAGLRIWGSPAYADEARWRASAERAAERCFHPAGTQRQFFAIRAQQAVSARPGSRRRAPSTRADR